ncbi:MAG: diacylglycerol kinase family protein [Bacteroidota bacterium]|nr:diacylglycerol kinase family protein [Bacteroidota bacterium]
MKEPYNPRKSLLYNFIYAWQGVKILVKTQLNAKIHVLATFAVVLLGLTLKLSYGEWALITIAIALVWITEAVNTAFEMLMDKITPEYDPITEKIKDISAAAVLFAAILAVLVGIFVLVPKLNSIF